MTDECNDLSPYELARFVRIKRNENRLRELGLVKPPQPKPKPEAIVRRRKQLSPTTPLRSSRRLLKLREEKEMKEVNNNSTTTVDGEATPLIDEDTVNYERMPDDPESLDDDEFQVYVSLRSWRLRRKNELEIEPYKICQNRTLCELIRRRRNDAQFAHKAKDANEIESDLLSVWGIGPSKASEGGFGWEMIGMLNKNENVNNLIRSRKTEGK